MIIQTDHKNTILIYNQLIHLASTHTSKFGLFQKVHILRRCHFVKLTMHRKSEEIMWEAQGGFKIFHTAKSRHRVPSCYRGPVRPYVYVNWSLLMTMFHELMSLASSVWQVMQFTQYFPHKLVEIDGILRWYVEISGIKLINW